MYIPRIIPIPILALSLLSCSSGNDSTIDPTPDTPQVGISFGGNGGTWENAPTSRATGTGLEAFFSTFRVWGYKTTDQAQTATQVVFNGYNAEYKPASATTTTATWEYIGINNPTLSSTQTIKYWDFAATSYRFLAYSPATANVSATEATDHTAMSLSVPFSYSDDANQLSTPYITDLWYSNNSIADKEYGKCVTLSFAPPIAKVRFKFTYPKGTKKIRIEDIIFADRRFIDDNSSATTPLRGNIIATYPLTTTPQAETPQLSWTADADNPTGFLSLSIPYEEASDEIHILDDEKLYEKWYYVTPLDIIPYEQGPYTIKAQIDGNYSVTTIPATYMQWKAGYQYTYVFKITEAGTNITFANLKVEKWELGTNLDNQGSGTEDW